MWKYTAGIVTLTIREMLPAMKKLAKAAKEHWKAMLYVAISEAGRQGPLPYFEKIICHKTSPLEMKTRIGPHRGG